MSRLFLFLTCTFTLLTSHFFANPLEEDTYLISYPRSGNTWTRYCIEYIAKRPTLEKEGSPLARDMPLDFLIPLGVDHHKPEVIKTHNILWQECKDAPLILVIRNYKEALIRHKFPDYLCRLDKNNPESSLLEQKIIDAIYKEISPKWMDHLAYMKSSYIHLNYFLNIYFFDQYPSKNKLVIYYEDLIHNTEKVLNDLTHFFGEGKENIASFMENISEHRKNGIWLYEHNTPNTSQTKGEKALFHSLHFSKETLQDIDKAVKSTYPELWEKYLKRYQTL